MGAEMAPICSDREGKCAGSPLASPAQHERRRRASASAAMAGLALILGLLAYEVPLSPGGDPAEHWVLAAGILTGQGYRVVSAPESPVETRRPPGYAAFLALWMACFGSKLWVAKAFSLCCFAGSASLAYVVLARLASGPSWLPASAALLFILNLRSLHHASTVGPEMLFTLFSTATVLLADRAAQEEGMHWRVAATIGALIALSTYVRPNGAALLPAVSALLLVSRRWRTAIVVALVAAVAIGPWGWFQARAAATGAHTYLGEAASGIGENSETGRRRLIALCRRAARNVPDLVLSSGQLLLAKPRALAFRAAPPRHTQYAAETPGNDRPTVREATTRVRVTQFARRASRYFLGGIVMVGWIGAWRRKRSVAHWYMLSTMLMLSAVVPYTSSRYLLPLMPFLGWYLVVAMHAAGTTMARRLGARWPVYAAASAVWCLCGASGILALAGVVQSVDVKLRTRGEPWWAPERYEYVGPDVADYVRAALWIRDNAPTDAVVVCRKPHNVYWVAHRHAANPLGTRDAEALWQAIESLSHYGPVYLVQDAFGPRYKWDLTTENLVPAIASHRGEVACEYRTGRTATVVWRLHRAKQGAGTGAAPDACATGPSQEGSATDGVTGSDAVE